MPLLGKDLCTLRNEQKSRCFTRSSVVRVGILSFLAIQELHGIGFISRDIKPGNFAIGLGPNSRRIFLFDFGLARKYMDHNKNIIPPRKDIVSFFYDLLCL
jgi:serine/threonine protein kinase